MHTVGMGPVLRRRLAVLACACSMSAACAGTGDGGSPASVDVASESSPLVDGDVFTEVGADEVPSVPGPDEAAPVVESIAPVAETGVPGIDSENAFCRAWSEYAGSVQALSFAWAVQPDLAAATLEVAASDAVSAAVTTMSLELPAEIESNRAALTVSRNTNMTPRGIWQRRFCPTGKSGFTNGTPPACWPKSCAPTETSSSSVTTP